MEKELDKGKLSLLEASLAKAKDENTTLRSNHIANLKKQSEVCWVQFLTVPFFFPYKKILNKTMCERLVNPFNSTPPPSLHWPDNSLSSYSKLPRPPQPN